jgi:hypothetical protein
MALGNVRAFVRVVIGALVVIAAGVAAWIISLPNIAECRALGRVVDPTERHCESGGPATYQQLQEHATMHAAQVVMYAFVVLGGAYVIYRLVRRLTAAKRVA